MIITNIGGFYRAVGTVNGVKVAGLGRTHSHAVLVALCNAIAIK